MATPAEMKQQVDAAIEKAKHDGLLKKLNSADELRNWVYVYLNIYLPSGNIDPDSNSSPVDAMWQIYDAVKNNRGKDVPGYIMLSSRDSYKTLSASIMEVVILLHFQLSIAHMAAILSQSNKAVSYVQGFFAKLAPYIESNNWLKVSDSKTKIQFQTPEGNRPYITIVICTMAGANCIGGDSVLELEDGSTVRAAEATAGMRIKTWDYAGDAYVEIAGVSTTHKQARLVTLSNGASLVVSDDHLVFTQDGWVFSDAVRVGDKMKTGSARAGDGVVVRREPARAGGRGVAGLDLVSGLWVTAATGAGALEPELNATVVAVEPLGMQSLVDIHVNHADITKRSFYANGIFVHNSEHVPIMVVDELDTIANPAALEEAKMIPSMERGQYPLTVKLSTRKFAFGIMASELDKIDKTGEKLVRWNILDVAEHCPPSRHKPNADGSKVARYARKTMPLQNVSPEEFESMSESEREKWDAVDLHPGCVTCPLASVCRGKLADRPAEHRGGLYKPIPLVITNFKKLSEDMAEAQLLCRKPSTKGLVYPRYEDSEGQGNLVSVCDAYELVTGNKLTASGNPENDFGILLEAIKNLDLPIYAGVDWGFTHFAALAVVAVLPSGKSLVLDNFAQAGLETMEFLEIIKEYHKKYDFKKVYCDGSSPQNVLSLRRAGIKCPDFTKDIQAGIDALRGQVVSTTGVRKFLVVNTAKNSFVRQGFRIHHFKLDAAGNPTKHPDDEEMADIMDALRYLAQNVYGVKSGGLLVGKDPEPKSSTSKEDFNRNLMQNEINKRTFQDGLPAKSDTTKKKSAIVWGQ